MTVFGYLAPILSQVHHVESHFPYLAHMPRPHCICVDEILVVWMKQALVPTIHDRLHAGWISEAEYTPSGCNKVLAIVV